MLDDGCEVSLDHGPPVLALLRVQLVETEDLAAECQVRVLRKLDCQGVVVGESHGRHQRA